MGHFLLQPAPKCPPAERSRMHTRSAGCVVALRLQSSHCTTHMSLSQQRAPVVPAQDWWSHVCWARAHRWYHHHHHHHHYCHCGLYHGHHWYYHHHHHHHHCGLYHGLYHASQAPQARPRARCSLARWQPFQTERTELHNPSRGSEQGPWSCPRLVTARWNPSSAGSMPRPGHHNLAAATPRTSCRCSPSWPSNT